MALPKPLAAAALLALVVGVPLALKQAESPRPDPAAIAVAAASSAKTAEPLPKLVDLGTTTCAPCKAMLGVLDELERGYKGQLAVEFINVAEQEQQAEKYAVEIIPTQVFLAGDGRELYRHTGFLAAPAIVAKWRELGYPLQPPNR